MTHDLKILPQFYNDVLLGYKTFEVRKNDRMFEVGDTVILKEYNGVYTGRFCEVFISYVLTSNILNEIIGENILTYGYCVFGWNNLNKGGVESESKN